MKNKIFETWEHQIDRFSFDHGSIAALPDLTTHQHQALLEIQKSFAKIQQPYCEALQEVERQKFT